MHKRAGQVALNEDLTNISALVDAYYKITPDHSVPGQRVAFGTSGHRGTSSNGSFNEAHIKAIVVAVAEYRATQQITGPLFIGADTHALSAPALRTALETLQLLGVRVLKSVGDEFVPTPALSHAILSYNGAGNEDVADGIIITPSHNPPGDGGIKYNPPHGGPADTDATSVIAQRANEILAGGGFDEKSVFGWSNGEVEEYDFVTPYVEALDQIIDMAALQKSEMKFAAHPLAGAGYAYWQAIKTHWGLNIDVLGPKHDPQWAFMTLDWDGKIRMDPSSNHAMAVTAPYTKDYELIVANDADADRFGVVTAREGLIAPNHVLAVAIDYLLATRGAGWGSESKIGKTLVSSAIIDRVIKHHQKELQEVPVGFKWFVEGLHAGTTVFGGEESAGASFLRKDGKPWSTDKDGILLCLLAAEITAKTGKSIGAYYAELEEKFGTSNYTREDAAATPAQKQKLAALTREDVTDTELAGEAITEIMTSAPGNGAPIGGLKVATANAWFAARPSGTEDVYKIYAESFKSKAHLEEVLTAARALVNRALN